MFVFAEQDSWEDDEEEEAEEKKDDEKAPVVKSKPKRSLKQIIAEKEVCLYLNY